MTKSIQIDTATCTKCDKCVKVCPSLIFAHVSGGEVTADNVSGCIACGHCVATCPTGSIEHSDFPPQTIHAIDYSTMPTPEQVMLLCKSRRSNRAFFKKVISESALSQILEAAHRAPTASNMQQVEFTLVTDTDKLTAITNLTIDTFAGLAKKLRNPLVKSILKPFMPDVYKYLPQFDRLTSLHAAGKDMILRGATAVIFIHTPSQSRFGCQDANMAYQNGSLMAQSLGVSQFYTGFVCTAIKQDRAAKIAKLLGITGTIHAGMALGMPLFSYPNYIDRKEIVVNR